MTEPTGERFIPELMGGELIEAEHHARYRLAAQHVEGKRLLDAGCGVGWGSSLLLEAGAASVTGIDISSKAVEAARGRATRGHFLRADLHLLPFAGASFDLVTCFEAIEHVQDPLKALDELTRVLTREGILLISSPNPRVYPPGNPFHVHEFTPEELYDVLSARFGSVAVWRQYDLCASFLVEGRSMPSGEPIAGLIRSVVPLPSDHDAYSVAVASSGPIPTFEAIAMLAPPTALQYVTAVNENLARENRELRRQDSLLRQALTESRQKLERAERLLGECE